jgi:hypothetical protein
MTHRAWTLLFGALFVGGCSTDDDPMEGSAPAGNPNDEAARRACETRDCSNPIDAVVIPEIVRLGLEPTKESDGVLCRRMAIDLTGAPPTAAEMDQQCAGRSPKELAAYFLGKPSNDVAIDGTAPYVFVGRRWWAMRYGIYENGPYFGTFFPYEREFDALLGELFSGKIGYDVFAIRALASAAFFKRFAHAQYEQYDLPSTGDAAFRIFLGRIALPGEAANFGELWRGWGAIASGDPRSGSYIYSDCPTSTTGGDGDPCVHLDVGLFGERCKSGGPTGCQSDVLGAASVVPTKTTFVPYFTMSDADKAIIETPGKRVVASREFAEAAVDASLRRYLGWWRAGTFVPKFDVPAVRTVLAKRFVEDRYDIRKLDELIVTSVLYAQAQTRPNATNVPLWAFGPTKMMPAVVWLDTFGFSGPWDFRFHDNTTPPQHFSKLPGVRWSVYRGISQATLGDTGGLNAVIERRGLLQDNCKADDVAPDATLESLLDRAFVRVGRHPTDEEKNILLTEMRAPGRDGCPEIASCDRRNTAIALCRSLYSTATFNFY